MSTVSNYIQTTPIQGVFKPLMLIALIENGGTATINELVTLTGFKKSFIVSTVGNALVKSKACVTTENHTFSICLTIDKDAKESCLNRLESFKKARGIK